MLIVGRERKECVWAKVTVVWLCLFHIKSAGPCSPLIWKMSEDLKSIINALEHRISMLCMHSRVSSVDSARSAGATLGVKMPKRKGSFKPNESKDASKLFYGKKWDRLKQKFSEKFNDGSPVDISGGQQVQIMTPPDYVQETYWVSAEFAQYIKRAFEKWQVKHRRTGEMITERESLDTELALRLL
jgi:hypothetical protein